MKNIHTHKKKKKKKSQDKNKQTNGHFDLTKISLLVQTSIEQNNFHP